MCLKRTRGNQKKQVILERDESPSESQVKLINPSSANRLGLDDYQSESDEEQDAGSEEEGEKSKRSKLLNSSEGGKS